MAECLICSGKRHVQDEKTHEWVSCECLLKQRRNEVCKLAGIPEEYWEPTVDSLKGFIPEDKILLSSMKEMAKFLREGFFPSPGMIIQGPAPRHKILGWLLLKSALVQRQGFTIGLDDLTTAFLTQDKAKFTKAREVDVLHLILGDEYTQTVHRYVCKHIDDYRKEKRFFTIWSTQLFKGELVGRYGELELFTQGTIPWLKIHTNSQI